MRRDACQMFLGPIRNPEAFAEQIKWWLVGTFFLILGFVVFVILGYFALTGIVTCGGSCAGQSALDIFFGQTKYLTAACMGFIFLVIGAMIFGIFRWGMLFESRHWREPYQRNRHP